MPIDNSKFAKVHDGQTACLQKCKIEKMQVYKINATVKNC